MPTMTKTTTHAPHLDLKRVTQIRAKALKLGLDAATPSPGSSIKAADLVFCHYDPLKESFTVVYSDRRVAQLPRKALADVGERKIMAWEVDEFRRGVFVVLSDGTATSFSAEYPLYATNAKLRREIEQRSERSAVARRVGSRVRSMREKRGWSVAELARQSKMAAPNVHRIESGAHVPNVSTLIRIANALGCPLDRLLAEGKTNTVGRKKGRPTKR